MKKHFVFNWKSVLLIVGLLSALGWSAEYQYPFQNPSLPEAQRVADLIGRMTPEEKMGQLMWNAPAIERLGIPAYNWWNECLHGVARNGRATIFPQAIGMAATFDTDLMQQIGSAIGVEGRAKFNACSAQGYRGQYQGLTFWTPNINIFRDPRWGRGQETYGEDPFLTGQMAGAFVRGLQGDNPRYLQAAGCAKHYAVHSGPEGLRHEFDAVVSPRDLWDTYLPAFETLVTEARVQGVMGAYNRTNGHPCCAHPYLMHEVLRVQWGFDGYFTSDCWAINDFFQGHKIVKTAAESAATALLAGCNLNCGDAYRALPQALKDGLITEKDVDMNLADLLPIRFRLGLFDPPDRVPFNQIGPDKIGCEAHVRLAHEAAVKSLVLLKNTQNTLPIAKDLRQVYVCGPLATDLDSLLANYYGQNENMVTILEGIVGKVSPHTSVQYRQGALLDRPNINPIDWFSGVAAESDITIACLGINSLLEGEEGESIASPDKGDRFNIDLPQNQIDFLKKIRRNAKKLVVILTTGSPVVCPELYDLADALLLVWYPGQQGGQAVADVLFGDAVPSGRLPITFPRSLADLPLYEDYAMAGRTYRYMTKEPMYPFGFGLSYTQFAYSNIKLSRQSISSGQSVTITATITNTGQTAGEEVAQLYITDLQASVPVPQYALKGMQRLALKPGQKSQVSFEITPKLLQIVDNDGQRILEPGRFQVTIASSCPSPRSLALGAAKPVSTELEVK